MIILGICDNHDSGVVLYRDNKIIFAANEERFIGEKLTFSFPYKSISAALEYAQIKAGDVDSIIIGTKLTPSFISRFFNKRYRRFRSKISTFSYSLNLFYIWREIFAKFPLFKEIETSLSWILFKIKFKRLGFRCRIKFVDHHLSHAASAFYTSGFDRALIFTLDGMGDLKTVTVSVGEGKRLDYALYQESAFSSIATFYSRITEYLGFLHLHHEGKIMALASYGDSNLTLGLLQKLLSCNNGRFKKINYFFKQSKQTSIYKQLSLFSKEDVAAAAQRVLEEEVCKFVSYWIKKINISKIVLAGGIFANIKLNQKIATMKEVSKIYIFPHMGDGGLAYGAVLAATKQPPQRLDNLFLGPSFKEEHLFKVLSKNSQIGYRRVEDIEREAAAYLADHKLIARFSGRMEYGPRALGNRSILYEAIDANTRVLLNQKLKRTEFMPFAPVLRYELKDKYFINTEKADYTAEFLNISFDCKEITKKSYPAIVHVDNTCRPQFVRKEYNPKLYKLLEYYELLSGLEILINTSFNMHEEPIICTPEDALSTFSRAELDFLLLENFVVYHSR